MTLIAGCVRDDGCLVAADTRGTWRQRTGGSFVTDDLQKVIKLTDHTVVAFTTEDMRTGDYLLPHMFEEIHDRHADPRYVIGWLPRFLRALYRSLHWQYPGVDAVGFMLASSLPGQPSRISRTAFRERVREAEALGLRGWLEQKWVIAALAANDNPVLIPGTSRGMLYCMTSPDFTPDLCPTYSVRAMGSGAGAITFLETYRPLLVSWPVESAVDVFVDAIGSYMAESAEPTVGGMLLLAHATNGRVHSLTVTHEDPVGGNIAVVIRDGLFRVQSSRTNADFVLEYPSQVLKRNPVVPIRFDELRDVFIHQRDRMRIVRRHITTALRRGPTPGQVPSR